MAKIIEKVPSITLADCISELELINSNMFTLRQAIKTLIEMIENDMSNEKLKQVIKVYNITKILSNLEYKDLPPCTKPKQE